MFYNKLATLASLYVLAHCQSKYCPSNIKDTTDYMLVKKKCLRRLREWGGAPPGGALLYCVVMRGN